MIFILAKQDTNFIFFKCILLLNYSKRIFYCKIAYQCNNIAIGHQFFKENLIMILKTIFLIYFAFITSVLAHSSHKKTLKAHEHGVGVLNIAQDGNSIVFEFEIPGNDVVGFEYKAENDDDKAKVQSALETLSEYKNLIKPSGSAGCVKESSSANIIYEGNHSEFISEYKFNCENVSDLKIIFINYFKNLKYSKKLNIKIAGSNKKSAYVIDKSKKILNVKGHF